MKREELIERLREIIFFGKDTLSLSEEVADFIEKNYKSQKNTKQLEAVTEETKRWINDWLNLFPAGVRSGGKLLRSDPRLCLKKMSQFRIDYPQYGIETIVAATVNYLQNKAADNYAYTICSYNFIQHRDKGSELAAECENIVNGKSKISVNSPEVEDFFL